MARRLLKEREDVMRELSKLSEHVLEAQHNMLLAAHLLGETSQQDGSVAIYI